MKKHQKHTSRVYPKLHYMPQSEDLPQIIYMVTNLLGMHDKITTVVIETIVEHDMKNSNCSKLVMLGGTSILDTKQYGCIMKVAHRSLEGILFDVSGAIFDLIIVAESSIKENMEWPVVAPTTSLVVETRLWDILC